MSDSVTVRTKEELEEAVESDADKIVVKGDLAKQIRNGRGIRKVAPAALAALVGAIAALPFTGGASMAVAAPIAMATGTNTLLVVAIITFGVVLLSAIWNGYDEVEFSTKPLKLVLRRKSKG